MSTKNYHFDDLYKYYAMIHARGINIKILLKINEERENYYACHVIKCLIEETRLTNKKTLDEHRTKNI